MTIYPRIAALGVTVHPHPLPHIKHAELRAAFRGRPWAWRRFCRAFGIKTQISEGLYARNVERALERMEGQ